MGRRLIFIAFVILILVIILGEGIRENKRGLPDVEISIIPENFSVVENGSMDMEVVVKVDGNPCIAKVNWILNSTGDTGQVVMRGNASTNKSGRILATYLAPSDVDEREHHVTIVAEVDVNGEKYSAVCHAIVYPQIHETMVEAKCNRKEIIAGETAWITARAYIFADKWIPLASAWLRWSFQVANESRYGVAKTDGTGMVKIPFYHSNARENLTAFVKIEVEENLSGEMDFASSNATLSIKIIPEKPGDFPVVLIHGWIGSTSNALINYTWYNITQKLVERGFKVLDFDTTKPGIQWLTYQPSWLEQHHIPWIAAKVSEKIQEALILNGYPPNQTIDIVAHSMGGLVARFMAEHYMADVDYWNRSWDGEGYPWYGDGDPDVVIGPYQIDDLIAVGTPCHGVPPNMNESFLRDIIKYAYFPWWMGQVPDMIYHSPFLEAMGYNASPLVDYYGVGGDIGIIMGEPMDFDGDDIAHYSDGLVPAESPYLTGRPLYILEGKAWPAGEEDHISLMAINGKVHDYVLKHLID